VTTTPVRVTAGLAIAAAAGTLAWGVVHTVREMFFHGFAVICSDGYPEYDARYCELPGGPSSAHVGAAVLVVAIALVARWGPRRRSGHLGLACEDVDGAQD